MKISVCEKDTKDFSDMTSHAYEQEGRGKTEPDKC